MSLRPLPEIKASRPDKVSAFELDDEAFDRWDPSLAPKAAGEHSITMLDVIGEDFSGNGVTAKRVIAALRTIGDNDVVVELNSPGGDFFEGIAIYNALRAHPRKVTVRILAQAASAASVIAMAGDEIHIAKTAHLLLHCAWCLAIGNQFTLADTIETLKPFDRSMAMAYAERTGVTIEEAMAWMSKDKGEGTYFTGQEAIDAGLADNFLPSDLIVRDCARAARHDEIKATRYVDALFRQQGKTRSESRALLADLKGGTHDAASNAMQDAGTLAALERLSAIIRS